MLADMVRRATILKPSDYVASTTGESFGASHVVVTYPAGIQVGDKLFIAHTGTPDFSDGASGPVPITGPPAGFTQEQAIHSTTYGYSYLYSKTVVSGDIGSGCDYYLGDLTAMGMLCFAYRPHGPVPSILTSGNQVVSTTLAAPSITTTKRKKRVAVVFLNSNQFSMSNAWSSRDAALTNRVSKSSTGYGWWDLSDFVKDGAGATGTMNITTASANYSGCGFQIQI